MGRWPLYAVLVTLGAVSAIGMIPTGAAIAQADIGDVMLDDIGDGFALVDESAATSGALTRTFQGDEGSVIIVGFSVSTPPGARTVFEGIPEFAGFDVVAEPTLELARWIVPKGGQPGDDGQTTLNFASRDHIFMISLFAGDGASLDGPGFALELAARQVDAAGAPAPSEVASQRSVDDDELRPLLPDAPPAGYDLAAGSLTVSGANELVDDGLPDTEIASFLNDRAKNVAAVWGGDELTVGVGITQYPYQIFAGAGLASSGDSEREQPDWLPADSLPDAVGFRDTEQQQVGITFRRGDLLVTVLTGYTTPEAQAAATALASDMAELVASGLPPGDTSPYEFPNPPSKLAGLGLTAGLVTMAVAGATVVARIRARRVRQRWASDPMPQVWPTAAPYGLVVALDTDAATLRKRGAIVAGVQLATVVVGVVALSGDFALVGVFVSALSLLAGLLFSRWWLQREHMLLGPSAPVRAFRVPRFWGALMGITAFAVLGIGVAYLLKGVRYIIFDPTLAQLRWSDLLGLAPRTVGVVFAVGGLLMTMLGAVLWRIARALGRARVREVLASDSRPSVLYLRSFGDDTVPLPIISSARRPMFELFSLRGADPFEECVAWELNSYGPVVAIGRPGRSLASLGAAREHLPNSTWHEEITERMCQAGSIVLAPAETEGLAWELREIVNGGHLGKTIFVFPPLAPSELGRRWDHTAEVLRDAGASVGPLPAPAGVVHTLQIGHDEWVGVTWAATRDEATYRTAVDRALELRANFAERSVAAPT